MTSVKRVRSERHLAQTKRGGAREVEEEEELEEVREAASERRSGEVAKGDDASSIDVDPCSSVSIHSFPIFSFRHSGLLVVFSPDVAREREKLGSEKRCRQCAKGGKSRSKCFDCEK